jgi:hypothetical protein
MGAYEDARNASEFPKRKPIMGDETHLNAIYDAIGDLKVPVSDKKAADMAHNAGDHISGALMSHRSGDPKTAWMKSEEAAKVVTTLANHLMMNHGVDESRALYASGHARNHVFDYGDTVEQQRDDEFRNGGNK